MYVCAHVVVCVTQLDNNNAHTQSLAQAVCTCNSCTSVDARELVRVRSRPRRTSRTTIIGLRMPNGHREPFRIGEWDYYHGTHREPSPVHTSDSEDTYVHKQRWTVLQRRVRRRWRRHMYERGIRRRRTWLMWLLFHHPSMLNPRVISTITRYLGPIRIHDPEYLLVMHL